MGVEEQIPWEDILAPPGTYTVFTIDVCLGNNLGLTTALRTFNFLQKGHQHNYNWLKAKKTSSIPNIVDNVIRLLQAKLLTHTFSFKCM